MNDRKHCDYCGRFVGPAGHDECREALKRINNQSISLERMCSEPGCNHPIIARGLCTKHYQRLKKKGLPSRPSPAVRLWAKVEKTDTCWLWQGALTNGYGYMNIGSEKHVGVHRLSYELANGEIPNDLLVCHKCDVRNCVRPDHLFLGTYTDNLVDSWNKGRVLPNSTRCACKRWVGERCSRCGYEASA